MNALVSALLGLAFLALVFLVSRLVDVEHESKPDVYCPACGLHHPTPFMCVREGHDRAGNIEARRDLL
jgi:hypothetical protein